MITMPSTSRRRKCSTDSSSSSRVSVGRLTVVTKRFSARAASSMVRWMLVGPK
jgi:hypothetical protein